MRKIKSTKIERTIEGWRRNSHERRVNEMESRIVKETIKQHENHDREILLSPKKAEIEHKTNQCRNK